MITGLNIINIIFFLQAGNVDKVLEKMTVYEDSTTSALDSDVISATPVESTAATTAVSIQSATLAASATAASSTVNITPTATTSEVKLSAFYQL